MEKNRLLPCPFCGAKANLTNCVVEYGFGKIEIFLFTCQHGEECFLASDNATFVNLNKTDKDLFVQKWNKRSGEQCT